MTSINPFHCKADEQGATWHEFCRSGREYRVLGFTRIDAEAALDDHLADPEPVGELPSLFTDL